VPPKKRYNGLIMGTILAQVHLSDSDEESEESDLS